MKYLVLLALLVGCSNQESELDKSIKSLQNSTKSLEFSAFSLKCLAEVNVDHLTSEIKSLGLPNTKEVAYILMDSKVYNCVRNRYKELDN